MAKRVLIIFVVLLAFGLYRLDQLNKKPVSPENFSTYNLVEIYSLGIVMSSMAYFIYPEIAQEHMSLMHPVKEDKHSCFFMESKLVANKVDNYTKPVMLAWPASDYMFGNPEARVALALNGATLVVSDNTAWVDVPIRYPRQSLVRLLPFVEVQEGLFWVLQEKGWYHAGKMRWICALNNIDVSFNYNQNTTVVSNDANFRRNTQHI